MNQIYIYETLAAKAILEFREAISNRDVHREIMECEGGFRIEPPLPAYDVPHEDELFLVGEKIPDEVRNKPKPLHNKILDDDVDYFELDLIKHIPDSHIMKRLSIAISKVVQIPVSSVFLVGLGVFSSITCRRYMVLYQYDGSVPCGNYFAIEQPSGVGKTYCTERFQVPFFKAFDEKNKRYKARIDELENLEEPTPEEKKELKELLKNPPMPFFSTNPTPEGLEKTLSKTNGFFAVVSSEQGAINSLLGFAYKDKGSANNNDVVLHGFDGGYHKPDRVSRDAYYGVVIGSIVSFAQSGCVEKVISASNLTGLAERFLFVVEPHFLGRRDIGKKNPIPKELIEEYNAIASTLAELVFNSEKKKLTELSISNYGHKAITEYRREIEPHLIDGGKYSHSSLRGAASKADIQIMKIAANLHLSSSIESLHSNQIPDIYIDAAIEIFSDVFEAMVQLCTKKGVIGERAELEALINYLSKDGGRSKTERQITNSLRATNPFINYSGSKIAAARKTFEQALKHGLITVVNPTEKHPCYKLA